MKYDASLSMRLSYKLAACLVWCPLLIQMVQGMKGGHHCSLKNSIILVDLRGFLCSLQCVSLLYLRV